MTQQLDMLTMAGDSALRAENDRLTALVADLQGQLAARPVPTVEAAPAEPPWDHEVIKLRAEVDDLQSQVDGKEDTIRRLESDYEDLAKKKREIEEEKEKSDDRITELEEELEEARNADHLSAETIAGKVYQEMTGQHITWCPDIVERERWISAVREALPS